MFHKATRSKSEEALTALLFLPLFKRRQRLLDRGIAIDPEAAVEFATNKADAILGDIIRKIASDTIDEPGVDKDFFADQAVDAIVPLMLGIIAFDVERTFARDNPLRANAAVERGVTLTTRMINATEIFATTLVVNHLVETGAAIEGVPPFPEFDYQDIVASLQWITEHDEAVCKICRPKDFKLGIDWMDDFPLGPPAHPHCRCFLRKTWAKTLKGRALFRIIDDGRQLWKIHKSRRFAPEIFSLNA